MQILAFVAVVRYFREVDKVRSNDVIIDIVCVTKLYLDPPTKWREHLGEYDLLVPDRLVATSPDRRPALHFNTWQESKSIYACGAINVWK